MLFVSGNFKENDDFCINKDNYQEVISDFNMFMTSCINNKEETMKFLKENNLQLAFPSFYMKSLIEAKGMCQYDIYYEDPIESLMNNPHEISLDLAEVLPFCTQEIKKMSNSEFYSFQIKCDEENMKILKDAIDFNDYTMYDVLSKDQVMSLKYTQEEVEFIKSEFGGQLQIYNKERENRLLKMLGGENYTLEKYIASIANERVANLSPLQKSVLAMYGKKIASMNDLQNLKINLFVKKKNDKSLGDCNYIKGKGSINVYDFLEQPDYTVEKYLVVINHECEHVIQEKNMMNCDLDADPNILTYVEDKFLRYAYGNDFYNENYSTTSFEFDAEFKAEIKAKHLLSSIDSIYEEAKQGVIDEMNSKEFKIYNEKYRVNYEENSMMRNFENQELPVFVFMEKALHKCLNSAEKDKTLDVIKNDFPLLEYEYNLEKNGERRSLNELFEYMENCTDDRTRHIAYNVILQRFNFQRRLTTKGSINQEYMDKCYSMSKINPKYINKYIDKLTDDVVKLNNMDEATESVFRQRSSSLKNKFKTSMSI